VSGKDDSIYISEKECVMRDGHMVSDRCISSDYSSFSTRTKTLVLSRMIYINCYYF